MSGGARADERARVAEHVFTRDKGCEFQVTEYNSIRDLQTHNVWAWGVTRGKWERMASSFEAAFDESRLSLDSYKHRNFSRISAVARHLCPRTGYDHWAGQDWLRACAFHANGMLYKMQPTNRLMSYIGERGMHTNAQRTMVQE